MLKMVTVDDQGSRLIVSPPHTPNHHTHTLPINSTKSATSPCKDAQNLRFKVKGYTYQSGLLVDLPFQNTT